MLYSTMLSLFTPLSFIVASLAVPLESVPAQLKARSYQSLSVTLKITDTETGFFLDQLKQAISPIASSVVGTALGALQHALDQGLGAGFEPSSSGTMGSDDYKTDIVPAFAGIVSNVYTAVNLAELNAIPADDIVPTLMSLNAAVEAAVDEPTWSTDVLMSMTCLLSCVDIDTCRALLATEGITL